MKRFTLFLSCLMANFFLFGQGGSGSQTNNYYIYGNNAANSPNLQPNGQQIPEYSGAITSHGDLPTLINQPNADLILCEKQYLEVGVTAIGTQKIVALYHYFQGNPSSPNPSAIPVNTSLGWQYAGWQRIAVGTINTNIKAHLQPALGTHYFAAIDMDLNNNNLSGPSSEHFEYMKVRVDEAFQVTTTPACADASISASVAGCAVHSSATFFNNSVQNYAIAWSNGTGNTSTANTTTYFPPHPAQGSVVVTYPIYISYYNANTALIPTHYNYQKSFPLTTTAPIVPIVVGSTTRCDNNDTYTIVNYQPGYAYSINVSHGTVANGGAINANGQFTVNWQNFPNPGIATITVTATSPNNCVEVATIEVASCCNGSIINGLAPIVFTNTTASQMGQSTNFTNVNRQIVMNGVIVIDQDLTITNCDHIKMAPNAEIVVASGKKLTIVNSNLKADECGFMWKGIVLPDPSANIEVKQNSEIWHAKNAVWAKQNADVTITESKFYNNHVGLRFDDEEPKEIAQTQTPNPSVIYANHFKKSGNYLPSDVLIKIPSIGILTDNIYMLTIGNATQIQNLFESLKTGISATNSVIHSEKNNFLNLSIRGIHFNNKLVLNGNGQAVYKVYSLLKVTNSRFMGSMTNAIYGTGQLEAENNVFENNSGLNTATIWVREITQNSYVRNNTFDPKNGSVGVNMQTTAIKLERAAAPFKGMKLDVENNTIYRYRSGIELTNTQGYVGSQVGFLQRQFKVFDNEVYNAYLNANQGMVYGIRLQNANGAQVVENEVERLGNGTTSDGRATFERGIALSQTQNAQVVNNLVKKHGNGIWSAGNLKGTFYGCNYLDATYYGFYFLPPSGTSNTILSTQGNSSFPSGNQWIDPVSTVGAFDRVAGQVNTFRAPKWYFNQGALTDAQIWQSFDPTKISGRQLSLPHPPTCSSFKWWEEPAFLAAYREAELGDIVQNEQQYQTLQEEFAQFGEEYMYNLFTQSPEVMDTDVPGDDEIYWNWMDSISSTNIAAFYAISEALDSGNINAAILLNAQILPENVIESNRKFVNYHYLTKYVQGKAIGIEDSLALLPIALQTPYVGGDAVFGARVMLGIDPDDFGLAYKGELDMGQEINEAYRVYPNPAKDRLNIDLIEVSFTEDTEILLLDVMGRSVLHSMGTSGSRTHSLPLTNINNGVYILRVVSGSETILTERVIISK